MIAVMDFVLSEKQALALQSPATELLYGGAAHGGKSYFLRIVSIILALAVPGLVVYLFRRTHPSLWRNHMEGAQSYKVLLKDYVRAKKVRWNGQHYTWEWSNGSLIKLCHCQHEGDIYEYQGADIHVLLLDEATLFTEDMYRFLRSLVRIGSLAVEGVWKAVLPRIICGTNPGNIGHEFLKRTFVIPSRGKSANYMWRADAPEGGMLRQFIQAKLQDNPFSDEGYAARLMGQGNPRLVKARLDGDWDYGGDGLMFGDVWSDELHVIREPYFRIPRSWYVDSSFDWGYSKPWGSIIWAEADGSPVRLHDGTIIHFPRGSLIGVNEAYGWNGFPNQGSKQTPEEIATDILEFYAGSRSYLSANQIHSGPADSSIYDTDTGLSIASKMERKGISFTRSNKNPGTRVLGWQCMHGMLRNAATGNKEAPWLVVFDKCEHFIRTIPSLPVDKRNADDVDTNAEDHIGDLTRYKVLDSAHGRAYLHNVQGI